MRKLITLFICLIINPWSTVQADQIKLQDGSVMMGEVVRLEADILYFKTSYAGLIEVKWSKVIQLTSDKTMTILLKDEQVIPARVVAKDNQSAEKDDSGQTGKIKAEHIAYINPEKWRIDKGYKQTGRVNLAYKSQHGNTSKEEFETDGELLFRGIKDRYFFEGQYERDSSDDEEIANNWLLSGKYDYFVNKKRYYGAELSFESDKYTDLDLRTTTGVHVGHQFYEQKEKNLSADIGLVKVYENNRVADDTDYFALKWNANYDQFFFEKFTQLYHKQKGVWDWEKSKKVNFTSWTGLRFPIRSGFEASTEVEWKYDSKPAPEIDKSDTTYRFKLGYKW